VVLHWKCVLPKVVLVFVANERPFLSEQEIVNQGGIKYIVETFSFLCFFYHDLNFISWPSLL
jgi:hypothetical protein